MIRLRHCSGVSATFVCCVALVASALCVLAQESKSETKTADDGRGGKITTTYSTYEGKNYVETVHTNGKGKLLERRTEISGPDGTVVEIEDYDFTGSEQLTFKSKAETDRSGEVTTMQSETYKDGILVKGEIAVLKNGDKHRTVVKKWSLLQDKYVDVPLEDQEKQRQMWKKFDEDLEKQRLERETFFRLLRSGKVSYESSGTGETIGHVADITVTNLTSEGLNFSIPPAILESKSGGSQDYACPGPQDVALGAGETKTVPMYGNCLERGRPPEPNGQRGDLVLNDGEPNDGNFDTHIDPEIVQRILKIVEAKYEAVEELEGEGAFKDFPYHDQAQREGVVLQWSTWEDPRISDSVHSPPVDKDDFKRNIDHQARQHGPINHDVRKKLDKGTDSMWEGIELTSEKAKDLENSDQNSEPPPSSPNVSDQTGGTPESPAPQTEEKPKTAEEDQLDGAKKFQEEQQKRQERKEKWDDWKKKQKLFYVALANKALAQSNYNNALQRYLDKNRKYREAKTKWDQAKKDLETARDKVKQAPETSWTKLHALPGALDDVDRSEKDFDKLEKDLDNLKKDLEKDFQKAPEGAKALEGINNAEKALEKAAADEDEAKKKTSVAPAPKT